MSVLSGKELALSLLWYALLLIVSGFFLVAAVPKIINPGEFSVAIENYRLFPWAVVPFLAFYVPWLELVCGVAIWVSPFAKAAVAVLMGLLAAFTIALSITWSRGIDIDCGCFGEGSNGLPLAVLRNFLLMGVCAGLWILRNRQCRSIRSD